MGLGKTFAGSEKMMQLGANINLIVCQKSKIEDWYEHFMEHYSGDYLVFDLTNKTHFEAFMSYRKQEEPYERVGIINYDLLWRRPALLKLKDFTLMLDESSLIQNETRKRSAFILKMQPKNVILLSGTPTGGKYEKLWSQMHLLGWNISKELYWKQYVNVEYMDVGMTETGKVKSIPIVKGYKNVDRLKRKMNEYGCQFLKTDEVFDLPLQTFTKVWIPASKEYRKFRKDKIVKVKPFVTNEYFYMTGEPYFREVELVGDTTLTKMLYERMLCSQYSETKLKAFTDLVESTEDRLIVFYNFTEELEVMREIVRSDKRPYSVVNGSTKVLRAYEECSDSITFVQYQAGAMGLNLQKANKIIYFSLPLSSELYEQSKKRIHRIGQERPCFYYQLLCKGTIEEKILSTLDMRQDFTEKLFEKDEVI